MKINFSPVAISDLNKILEYYSETLQSISSGVRIVRSIQKSCSNLKNFPNLGKKIEGFNDLFCNYRFLIVDSYCIVYKIDVNNIFIETIIDTRRDYMKVLLSLTE